MTTVCGELRVQRAEIYERPSFVDYLQSGWQVALSVAIDFTESNKDPQNPQSLHNLDSSKNQYEQALRAVGEVLEPYDSDQLIPTYGFGGVPLFLDDPQNQPYRWRDCFPLNGNLKDPEIEGLDKLLETYRSILPKVSMSGPTHFAPFLK